MGGGAVAGRVDEGGELLGMEGSVLDGGVGKPADSEGKRGGEGGGEGGE